MKVHLAHGPNNKQSIAKAFPDGIVPPQLLAIQGRNALSLKTGRKFKVENDDQFCSCLQRFSKTSGVATRLRIGWKVRPKRCSLIKAVTDATTSRGPISNIETSHFRFCYLQ